MITFVTFHVDLDEKSISNVMKSYKLFNDDFDYISMIDFMFKSALIFNPDCKKVVLTNHQTDFSTLQTQAQLFRTEIDLSEVMPSRLRAQIEYIKTHDFTSNLILLDSDMIVNSNLEPLFQRDFDVALTYIDKENMPFNGGAILINKNSKQKAIEFLEKVDRFCKTKYSSNTWWSDQQALVDAVGLEAFQQRKSDIIHTEPEGVKVLLLPCDTYNFAPHPPDKVSSVASELSNKKIIHFRGDRKQYMKLYWTTYLASREQPRFDKQLRSRWNKILLRAVSLYEKVSRNLWSRIANETY